MKKLLILLYACCISQNISFAQERYVVCDYNNASIMIGNLKASDIGKASFLEDVKITLKKDNNRIDKLQLRNTKLSKPFWLSFNDFKLAAKIMRRNYHESQDTYSMSMKDLNDLGHEQSSRAAGPKKTRRPSLGPYMDYNRDQSIWTFVGDENVKGCYNEYRAALIIGNSLYYSDSLDNVLACVNSANMAAEELRKIGFHTIVLHNAERDSILSALDYFSKIESKNGQDVIKMFYYVGHGMRNENDYIIPVDATSKNDITQCINISAIADSLDKNCNGFNLLFIDACRNGDSMTKHSGEEYQNLKNTLVICSTNNGNAAFADSTTTDFTLPFVNHIKDQNSIIQTVYNSIRDEVLNQNTTLYPNSERRITKKKINHEKMGLWAGLGVKAQLPIKSDLPTAWVPYATFGVKNIYVGRWKTQLEIDLGWNVCKKTTPPVYLYDEDDVVAYASNYSDCAQVSFRYGPSIDICSKCTISLMPGLSYHCLRASTVDGLNIDSKTLHYLNPTINIELSHMINKKLRLNVLVGINFIDPWCLNMKSEVFNDVSFMKDLYKDLSIGVGLTYRLSK